MTTEPPADSISCALSDCRPVPGMEVSFENDTVTVSWEGKEDARLRIRLIVSQGCPVIRELAIHKGDGRWITLGQDLVPELGVTTGRRRTGHGLPHENRWDVYWDAPLSIPGGADGNPDLPRAPDEVRRFVARCQATSCSVKSDGARLEISFPGLSMGIFSGSLRFTVYRGTNLVRMEAVAKTEEPSVAYKYYAGLNGFSTHALGRLAWRDVGGNTQKYHFGGTPNHSPVALRARNRLAVLAGDQGSLAFFPPPHKFFFARQLEVNLGYVWYRKDDEDSYSVGIRQGDSHEGYEPTWIERVFALYNAPPGTWQRMPVYFYLSAGSEEECREDVMAFTHADRYKPLDGYKTMVTHFHVGFGQELLESGTRDLQPPWIPAFRALGVNIALINDFHGDGHPQDPGPLRLMEMANYYEACRRHSDTDFLIVPSEEPNAYLGGHYNILFPRPVYWTLVRSDGTPFVSEHPEYGQVYHCGSAGDVFEMLKREDALVWQTHPRTKNSTFYPDRIKDSEYFRSDQWLGAAFKSLPVDLSEKRLGEIRCFGTLDDMNNWGRPKYLLGEVDTYKKFPEYDLYGDFNVNYVRLDSVSGEDAYRSLKQALRDGEFFVTTGEVLIPHAKVEGSGDDLSFIADVEWTFPLDFVELVFGDGECVDRQIVSTTDHPPFGAHRFEIPFSASGKKWVRFAAWDSAGNGAFTQPLHLADR